MILAGPAIGVPHDQNGTTVRRTEPHQATAFLTSAPCCPSAVEVPSVEFRRNVCFAVAHPFRSRMCSAVISRSRIAEKLGRGTLDVVEICLHRISLTEF